MGLWLGIWSWCFIGSLSLGFVTGAGIIADLNPAWGFYIVVIILAFVLLLNIVTPETRRAMYRQSVAEYRDEQDRPNRILARGEVKLHVSAEAPKYWYEEVWAGMELSCQMLFQFGFAVLAVYWAWIYAQIVLVIVVSVQSAFLAIMQTNVPTAPRCLAFQRLSLLSAVRRLWCSLNWNRRAIRCPLSQGFLLESGTISRTADGQHDHSSSSHLDVSPSPPHHLHDHATVCGSWLHACFSGKASAFPPPLLPRRSHWVSVQSRNRRVSGADHGNLRHF